MRPPSVREEMGPGSASSGRAFPRKWVDNVAVTAGLGTGVVDRLLEGEGRVGGAEQRDKC